MKRHAAALWKFIKALLVIMNRLIHFYYSVFNNFLVPDKLREYREILDLATTQGYSFLTLEDFHRAISGNVQVQDKYIIIRHDIDTDPSAALEFARAEAEHGIHATYFFRLKTWDQKIVAVIKAQGHEVGYHFEEIASYAKQHRLRSARAIEQSLPLIKAMFCKNLTSLRKHDTISSFASHGDFANRILGVSNSLLLQDENLRKEQGIVYEAYDEQLIEAYGTHLSDKPYPQRYSPNSPQELIKRGDSFLWLSHPRWWRRNLRGNLVELKDRIIEGILW